MTKLPLLEIVTPSEPPGLPKAFSFSYLKRWKECPSKLYLESSTYAGLPGEKYPLLYNQRQLEGDLIHKLIEIASETAKTGSYKSAVEVLHAISLRKVLREHIGHLRAKLELNPRVRHDILVPSLDIDRIINVAKDWVFSELTFHQKSSASSGENQLSGSEVTLGVQDPPLFGKLDFVSKNEIIDFKTGEPDDSHQEQMLFYTLIWKLRFGYPPAKATLLYSRTSEVVEVTAMATQLQDLEKVVRAQIAEIRSHFEQRKFPAKPDAIRCKRCAVRHLCDSYWINKAEGENVFDDLRLVFDPKVSVDGPSYFRSSPEGIEIGLGISNLPPKDWYVSEARILNVRLDREKRKAHLMNNSEIFWKRQ